MSFKLSLHVLLEFDLELKLFLILLDSIKPCGMINAKKSPQLTWRECRA